jgi:hypothetical protein
MKYYMVTNSHGRVWRFRILAAAQEYADELEAADACCYTTIEEWELLPAFCFSQA